MELWHGSLADFVKEAKARSLPGTMLQNFWNHHGYAPSTSEIRSWEHSLDALADALQGLQARDIGIVLEYHLPYSGYRIDVLLAGKMSDGANCIMTLELKQWSDVTLADNSLNVVINGVEHLHLPQQALDYSEHLCEIHSSFSEYSITGASCSFCHNLPNKNQTLSGTQFGSLLAQSPLFKEGDEALLVDFIENWVGGGDGERLMRAFIKGRLSRTKGYSTCLMPSLRGTNNGTSLTNSELRTTRSGVGSSNLNVPAGARAPRCLYEADQAQAKVSLRRSC